MEQFAYKFRIYPNNKQKELINKTIGCNRLMYNLMLAERKEIYEKYKNNKEKLYKYKYKTIKQIKNEYQFMSEVDSQCFMWTFMNLKNAYNNFYKSLKIKNNFGFPQFKKKKYGGSYTTSFINNNIKIDYVKHKIKIPKLKWINYKDNRKIIGKIKHITISKDSSEHYFISFNVQKNINIKQKEINNESKILGLDMSLQSFFIDSNNNSPEYIRFYKKYEKHLKRLNKKISKKKYNSNRYKKLRKSINRIYYHITNKRTNFLHNLSNKLVKENDIIVVESLNLKGMSKIFGKSISDLGYYQFIWQLQYKLKHQGKYLIFADRFFASSKICHNCGHKYKELQLKDRQWICPNCGSLINRDLNAALNLKSLGESIIHKCTLR